MLINSDDFFSWDGRRDFWQKSMTIQRICRFFSEKLKIFMYFLPKKLCTTCVIFFLRPILPVESVFRTFRAISARISNWSAHFCRPKSKFWGPQNVEISQKSPKKSLLSSKKRVLSLKISQTDVLTGTSYYQSMSVIAISVGVDYIIFGAVQSTKSTF